MKLYLYRGLDDEEVPNDVTHVIVHESVTVIKADAFYMRTHLISVIMGDNVKLIESGAFHECEHLVSIIMGDNVETIEQYAFHRCYALRFVRLSKTLKYIGACAFMRCVSLEALFLPSTVRGIERNVFCLSPSLRLLILPNGIDLDNPGEGIIEETGMEQVMILAYYTDTSGDDDMSDLDISEWLIYYMDEWPFHKLCYKSSINTQKINNFINAYGKNSALEIEEFHGMTPLHMLSMNPHAPADAISALLNSNMEAFFLVDNRNKTALDYARDYNVGGLVAMIAGLCNHRNSLRSFNVHTNENATMKRRIDLE
eukprot:45547_1